MEYKKLLKWNRLLIIVNILILTGFTVTYFLDRRGDEIEARRIVLRGDSGVPSIILQGDDENTLITLNAV